MPRNPLDAPLTAVAGAWLIALTRVAIGVGVLVAPRESLRLQWNEEPDADETLVLARMAGARDVALGLGTLIANVRDARSVRGWIEGGALADACDAVILATAQPLRLRPRLALAGLAAIAAVAGSVVARQLTGASGAAGKRL